MKKLLLLFSLIFFNPTHAQQNLVLNPSFEDNVGGISCSVFLWPQSPIGSWGTGSYGTIDVISSLFPNTCGYSPSNISLNPQTPRTGNQCVGMINIFSTSFRYREYLRGNLSENLVPGVVYQIEFYVCLAAPSKTNIATNNIGVKFVNNSFPFYETVFEIPETPDVNYSGTPISDRLNWTLVSFTFTPTETNLDQFIIGNFFDDENTNIEMLSGNDGWKVNYLLIDDVNIYVLIPIFYLSSSICEGDDIVLPTISSNGVEGTWSPAPNNQQTTTYTFTPNNPLLESIQETIIVKPRLIPEFDEIGPFCDQVPNINSLPIISKNGIDGSWTPAFNPNQTTTYTFTPNDAQCIETITKEIIIDKTPTFDSIEPFCEIDLNFSLPTISTNGISGTWSPDYDPYNSQTYTFTRDYGHCTQQVSLDVVVYPQLIFDLNHSCNDDVSFVEIIANNFSLSEIKEIKWVINNFSVSESGSKINLSKYQNLLQEVNTIEVIFTDSNNCLQTKEIEVLGKYFCNIQKGISPNGDGFNEYLDLVSFGGVDLKIFNRYGNVVYEKSNYKNEWHGQSKEGKNLPSGTYFYQIQTNIGEQFTGYIQLTY